MPMPGTIISPVLVGRIREMEILDRALRVTQNGSGRCVLLVGEAGIGKSRLAAELGDRATAAH
jgi:predicted ATPase